MPSFSHLPIGLHMALWSAMLRVALTGASGVCLLSALDDVAQDRIDAAPSQSRV
ncbi:MAG: hypothetical protein U0893_23000 [Chloroflexota bacterium]